MQKHIFLDLDGFGHEDQVSWVWDTDSDFCIDLVSLIAFWSFWMTVFAHHRNENWFLVPWNQLWQGTSPSREIQKFGTSSQAVHCTDLHQSAQSSFREIRKKDVKRYFRGDAWWCVPELKQLANASIGAMPLKNRPMSGSSLILLSKPGTVPSARGSFVKPASFIATLWWFHVADWKITILNGQI